MILILLFITITPSPFLNDFSCTHLYDETISYIEILNTLRENGVYYILVEPSIVKITGAYLTEEEITKEIKRYPLNPETTLYGRCVSGNKGVGIIIRITRTVEITRLKIEHTKHVILLKRLNGDITHIKVVMETRDEKCEHAMFKMDEKLKITIPSHITKVEIIPLRGKQEIPELIIPFMQTKISLPPVKSKEPLKRLLELINEERRKRGIKEVSYSRKLSEVAGFHSKEMVSARFFSHYSPNTGNPADRVRRFNISFSKITENIGKGETPEEIHALLMDSPVHKCNIIDPEVSMVGIGVTQDSDGFLVITENFIAPGE